MDTRKRKRAATKGKAIDLLLKKLSKRKPEAVAAIEMAVESGWTGFEWGWYDNRKQGNNGRNDHQSDGGAAKRASEKSMAKQRHELISTLADMIRDGEAIPGGLDRCTREVRKTYGQDAVAEAERMAVK